jgi:alpha-L-fucosidase
MLIGMSNIRLPGLQNGFTRGNHIYIHCCNKSWKLDPSGGTLLDDKSVDVIQGIGWWMAVNGSAIYERWPWKVFDEGPTRAAEGEFSGASRPWTAWDFRFACKGDTQYAFQMLGQPTDKRSSPL